MDNQIIIPEQVKNQAEATSLMASNYQIVDKDSLESGGNILVSIYKIEKLLKEKQDSIIKPMREAIKATQSMFSPYLNNLEKAEEVLKGKVAEYKLKEQARLDKERIEAIKNIDPFDTSDKTMNELDNFYGTRLDGISLRNNRSVIITNPDLIPDEYWQLDLVKIRKDCLVNKKKIPGVEIQINKSVVVRS